MDAAMLVGAPSGWPSLRIESVVADHRVGAERVTETDAVLRLKTGGTLMLDREDRVARYALPRPLGGDEIVHPFLAPAAAVFAHWRGHLSFHAGAFVADGGVWAVAGSREAGKSTLLAKLAIHGHAVLADDVLILDRAVALAGPRAIDLREDAARRLGAGEALGLVGTRSRWRMTLPQCRAELPFRGWMFLEWGERPAARRLRASECLRLLTDTLTVRLDATDPRCLLDLAALPAWMVGRTRDWKDLDQDADRLLDLARQCT